jgi:hypothetical protein
MPPIRPVLTFGSPGSNALTTEPTDAPHLGHLPAVQQAGYQVALGQTKLASLDVNLKAAQSRPEQITVALSDVR